MGEFRELDWALGEVAVAPDAEREAMHRTTRCPSVVAGFRILKPGDDGFEDVITLDICEWCRREWLGLDHDDTDGC